MLLYSLAAYAFLRHLSTQILRELRSGHENRASKVNANREVMLI